MSGTPKPYDGHYQSHDELGFSQFQENDGGEISWNGEDDGNPAPQATHSTTVDGLFQPQETEFLSLLSPFSDFQPGLGWIGLGVSSNWREFSTRHLLTHPGSQHLNFWPVEHAAAAHGKSLALLDNVSEYFAAATVLPPVAWEEEEEEEATLLQPPAGLTNAGEQFTAAAVENDEEALLKKLRAAGYGYAAISEKMREQLGIEITANALVKRYQKLPKTCENVVANAITNIMPQIMEQIYVELPHIDDGTLSEEEKQIVDRMLQDLPQILPNCVRSSLSRKRRTMQPSPSL